MLQQADIIVGMARVIYGPPLPPEMAWRRTFNTLFNFCSVSEVPKPVSLPPSHPLVLSKLSWSLAFDDVNWVSKLVLIDDDVLSSPVLQLLAPRPVARALFPTSSMDVAPQDVVKPTSPVASDEKFSFSAQCVKKKRARRTVVPVVDSSLRRCTRGSIKRDGFKPVLQ